MNEFQQTLIEGVVLGLEHAERMLKNLPVEQAIEGIRKCREQKQDSLKPERELTSEQIPTETL